MLSSKDTNFLNFTYKNLELSDDPEHPGIAQVKKKNNKPTRRTFKSILHEFADTEEEPQSSSLNSTPSQLDQLPESLEPSPHSSISSEDSQSRHR
jgi:serine/threonine kinase 38